MFTTASREVGDMASTEYMKLMDRIWSGTADSPYGFVDNDVYLYEHSSDGTSTYDFWAALHEEDWGMHPGIDRWGTDYLNHSGFVTHNWDWQDELRCRDLGETYPNDDENGYSTSFKISVSTYGATGSVGWSDSVGCSSIDNRSYPDDYARWHIEMNCDSTQKSWTSMKPGSEMRTCEFDGWEEVLASQVTGYFVDQDWWDNDLEPVSDSIFFYGENI